MCGPISVFYMSSLVPFFKDSTDKHYRMVFVFVWSSSLTMIISKSILVAANMPSVFIEGHGKK